MSWFFKVYANYANFRGRASRSEYWYFILFYLIVFFILAFIDGIIVLYSMNGIGLLSGIFALASFIPMLALLIRRIHDTGNTGWWWLISFVPVIGFFVILFFALKDSEEGTNEYGANPKGVIALN